MTWTTEELAALPVERLSNMVRDGEISPNAARAALNLPDLTAMSGSDFGSPEERAVALRVALAAKELNRTISEATRIGVSVEVKVLPRGNLGAAPIVQVGMERRTMILPMMVGVGPQDLPAGIEVCRDVVAAEDAA